VEDAGLKRSAGEHRPQRASDMPFSPSVTAIRMSLAQVCGAAAVPSQAIIYKKFLSPKKIFLDHSMTYDAETIVLNCDILATDH